jgi:hypothetical protein
MMVASSRMPIASAEPNSLAWVPGLVEIAAKDRNRISAALVMSLPVRAVAPDHGLGG